jgi:hypothetical protein
MSNPHVLGRGGFSDDQSRLFVNSQGLRFEYPISEFRRITSMDGTKTRNFHSGQEANQGGAGQLFV